MAGLSILKQAPTGCNFVLLQVHPDIRQPYTDPGAASALLATADCPEASPRKEASQTFIFRPGTDANASKHRLKMDPMGPGSP